RSQIDAPSEDVDEDADRARDRETGHGPEQLALAGGSEEQQRRLDALTGDREEREHEEAPGRTPGERLLHSTLELAPQVARALARAAAREVGEHDADDQRHLDAFAQRDEERA